MMVAVGAVAVLAVAATAIEALVLGDNWTRAQYTAPLGQCATRAHSGQVIYWFVMALIAAGPALLMVAPARRVARTDAWGAVIVAMLVTGVLGAGVAWLFGRFCIGGW
jgi:hypothetical protein